MSRWIVAALAAVSLNAVAQPKADAGAQAAPAAPAADDGIKVVSAFDIKQGDMPEGMTATADALYVGLATKSQIIKVALPDGAVTPFAELPKIPAGKGFVTGIARDGKGNLYVGLASFVPEVKGGVYKIDAKGGQGQLWASDPKLTLPNGLVFDKKGNLLVTDSFAGAVFSVDKAGKVSEWVKSDLLMGDKNACPPPELEFSVGANGIALDSAGNAFVANTDHGTLVRIPVKGGKAGTPEVFVGPDCGTLEGMDGITVGPDGNVYVAANRINKLVKIGKDKSVTLLKSGGKLDFPASPHFGVGKKDKNTLYITNFAMLSAQKPGAKPLPGVISVEIPTK